MEEIINKLIVAIGVAGISATMVVIIFLAYTTISQEQQAEEPRDSFMEMSDLNK